MNPTAIGLILYSLLMAAPARAATDPIAERLRGDFLSTYKHTNSFVGVIGLFEKKGAKTSHTRLAIALEKPNRSAFTILEDPDHRSTETTKVVWFGDQMLHVRTRFFGFSLNLDTGIEDDRLRDLRGNSSADLAITNAIEVLRQPETQIRYLGDETYLGRPAHLIEMRSTRLLKGIDREVIWLDNALKLPLVREMYSQGELVYRLTVESYKFDGPLPENTFKLE